MPTPPREPYRDLLSELSGAAADRLSRIWPSNSSAPGGKAGGVPGPAAWQEEDLEMVLRQQLDAPLAELGPVDTTGQPAFAGALASTLAELFAHPSPPTQLLRRVKDWAKEGMNQRDDRGAFPVPREVAGVLYFAAISAALARLGERISGLDDAGVARGGRWALAKTWLDQRLDRVLREGLAASTFQVGAE